jgi:hypothetical protein
MSEGSTAHRPRPARELYAWEKERGGSVRAAHEAAQCIAVMLRRIEMTDPDQAAVKADAVLHKHLIAYGMEVHLNIAWYARQMKSEERKRLLLLIVISLLAIFGISAIPLFWRFGSGSSSDWNLIFFQLTAFPAAAFAILRVLSTLTDARCRLGVFWRARADLAEILYLFEHKWQGRYSPAHATEFQADVDSGISSARQITREERQKFFDSLLSPGDLLTSVQQAFGAGAGRFQGGSRMSARMIPSSPAEPPEVAAPSGTEAG